MSILDITSFRNYTNSQLRVLYMDILYYIMHPLSTKKLCSHTPIEIDKFIKRANKNIFKDFSAKDYIQAVLIDNHSPSLHLYVKLCNYQELLKKIGPFLLDLQLFKLHKTVQSKITQLQPSIVKTSLCKQIKAQTKKKLSVPVKRSKSMGNIFIEVEPMKQQLITLHDRKNQIDFEKKSSDLSSDYSEQSTWAGGVYMDPQNNTNFSSGYEQLAQCNAPMPTSPWQDQNVFDLPLKNLRDLRDMLLHIRLYSLNASGTCPLIKNFSENLLREVQKLCYEKTQLQITVQLGDLSNDRSLNLPINKQANNVLTYNANPKMLPSHYSSLKRRFFKILHQLQVVVPFVHQRFTEQRHFASLQEQSDDTINVENVSTALTTQLKLELQLGSYLECDEKIRLSHMRSHVDLYLLLAIEGKREFTCMREYRTQCTWRNIYTTTGLRMLCESRLAKALSSGEDTLCRAIAFSKLLAHYARIRNHALLNDTFSELLLRQTHVRICKWPRELASTLQEHLLRILQLTFHADMPAALMSTYQHNYCAYGAHLFNEQISFILAVLSLQNHFMCDQSQSSVIASSMSIGSFQSVSSEDGIVNQSPASVLRTHTDARRIGIVTNIASGFEQAIRLWFCYVDTQRPRASIEQLVHFCRTLQLFCSGLASVFKDGSQRNISQIKTKIKSNLLEKAKKKKEKKSFNKNHHENVQMLVETQLESPELRRVKLAHELRGRIPRIVHQILSSIHVIIDYHLCNWIPLPLKQLIDQLALPVNYGEATDEAKRNAIFQSTPFKDIYNSLRVAVTYLNSLHIEQVSVRISLSTIQCWFPLNVTQAWVAEEILKIEKDCKEWNIYLRSLNNCEELESKKRSRFSVTILDKKKSIEKLIKNSVDELSLKKELNISKPNTTLSKIEKFNYSHLVSNCNQMYESLIAFVSWPHPIFPAKVAKDIVYCIDLVAVVLKTLYQKMESNSRLKFEQFYKESMENFICQIKNVNERLSVNFTADPEMRMNVIEWIQHQEKCWRGVLISLAWAKMANRHSILIERDSFQSYK